MVFDPKERVFDNRKGELLILENVQELHSHNHQIQKKNQELMYVKEHKKKHMKNSERKAPI